MEHFDITTGFSVDCRSYDRQGTQMFMNYMRKHYVEGTDFVFGELGHKMLIEISDEGLQIRVPYPVLEKIDCSWDVAYEAFWTFSREYIGVLNDDIITLRYKREQQARLAKYRDQLKTIEPKREKNTDALMKLQYNILMCLRETKLKKKSFAKYRFDTKTCPRICTSTFTIFAEIEYTPDDELKNDLKMLYEGRGDGPVFRNAKGGDWSQKSKQALDKWRRTFKKSLG